MNNTFLNPFYLLEKWQSDGLDYIIANKPTAPNDKTSDYANVITEFLKDLMYSNTLFATNDKLTISGIITGVLNFISSNSWCKDCCNNTFQSPEELIEKISTLAGFTPISRVYSDQILKMPCTPTTLNLEDYIPVLSQLESTILTDTKLSQIEQLQILSTIAISKSALNYWLLQDASGGPWKTYMTPIPVTNQIRSFWLMNILGSIICSKITKGNLSGDYNPILGSTNLAGSLTAVTMYCFFK
jgi:hypothetical protein